MKIAGVHAINRKAIVDGVVMMDSAAERDGKEMAVMVKLVVIVVINVQQTQVLLIKKYIIIDPSNIQTSIYFCQQPLKLFLPWLADHLVIQGLLEFIWTGGCSGRSSNPGLY